MKHERVSTVITKYDKYLTSYKSVKTSLKSIVKDNKTIKIINEIVCRMNKINIHTYHFLKLFCIHYFEKHDSLPVINKQLIVLIMKTIGYSNKSGRKFKEESQKIINTLNEFYNEHYEPQIMDLSKISYIHLTQMIEYESVTVMTCLSNHIQEHFKDLLNRYINILVDFDKLKEDNSNSEINRRLNKVKSDIYFNKSNADPVYDPIKELFNSRIIKSFNVNKSLCYMTQSNTIDLMVLLIRMSIDGEKIMKGRQSKDDENKLFNIINCFPLRKNICPKYIDIDTNIITHNLMIDDNLKLSDEIWNKYFHTNKKVFKKKGYDFNRRIVTDGIGCTILFIRSDLYDPFKKSNVRHLKKPKNYKSDYYINEIPEEQLIKLRGKKLIGIDPGKSDLIFCTDGYTETIKKDNGKIYRKTRTFKYSNGQRKMETKSKIYSNKLENDKKQSYMIGL